MAFVVVEFENNSTNDENEVGIVVSSKWFTDHTRKKYIGYQSKQKKNIKKY